MASDGCWSASPDHRPFVQVHAGVIRFSSSDVLPESEWQARRHAHENRIDGWIAPHRARAARGEKHPVHDFLFTYYSFRPAWLRRWHPGVGYALGGNAAREFLRWAG